MYNIICQQDIVILLFIFLTSSY